MPTTPREARGARTAAGCHLDIQIVDVLSGAPLRTGGYVKSCTVSFDRQSIHYFCPDQRRHPRADLTRALYDGHTAAEERQRRRFFRYASAGLKLLGAWDGEVSESFGPALGEAIVDWYRCFLQDGDRRKLELEERGSLLEAVRFVAADPDFSERLHAALRGWDQVDGDGHIRIALPSCGERRAVRVRLELQDFKYLTEEDVASVFASVQATPSAGLASHFHVAYERHGAPFDQRDPDQPRQESIQPLSHWCIRANHDTRLVRHFRNFADFGVVVEPAPAPAPTTRLYALCYCQPSWYETVAYHRSAEPDPSRCTTDKLARRTTLPAISTTYDGDTFNHGAYGVVRKHPGSGPRLHTGLDLAGREDTTPNFAIKGGRVYQATGRLVGIHHDEEQFTHYDHLHRRFPSRGQWVKAGSLIGMTGRRGIPEDLPTHTHLEIGADEQASGPAGGGGNAALAFVRDPGSTLVSWVAAQIGESAAALYREGFPRNTSSWYVPPCQGEYRSLKNKPIACTAACLGEHDTLVAGQVRFAQDCFAVRTNRDPRLCACPGLSERGVESCFSRRQRIQHQLWVAGAYQGAFDGRLEGDSRSAILAVAGRLDGFRVLLERTCREGIATRTKKSKPWPVEPGHVLAELLRDADHVKLLLSELEMMNGPVRLPTPGPVSRHRRSRSLRGEPAAGDAGFVLDENRP